MSATRRIFRGMKMNVSASNVFAAAATVSLALLALLAACSPETSKRVSSDGQPSDTAIVASGSTPARSADAAGAAGGAGALRSATDYVGLQYDSLPANLTYEGGSVLPRGSSGVNADYDFSHVATPRGDMVWFDTLDFRSGGRLPARLVRAALTIPPLAKDERLFMASCDVNGKFDSRVVAIVVNEPKVKQYTKVRQAWRVNIPAARFDVIPVAGVVCEDPGS